MKLHSAATETNESFLQCMEVEDPLNWGNESGADLGFFKHKSNAEDVRIVRGVRGILKSRVPEMQFQAF